MAGTCCPTIFEEWVSPRREPLQHTHRRLLLILAQLYEGQGKWSQAQALLRQLVSCDPLHEEGHAALMRICALMGDRVGALRQYQRLRETMRRDLGVEPRPDTARLAATIQSGGLGAARSWAAPGEEGEIRPVRRKALSSARAPALRKPAPRPHGNLPLPLTSFVGRQSELADIRKALSLARIVTLVGPGGCGKTRLALQVGADLAAGFEHGVWFAELAPLVDPEFVPQAVASALGVPEETGRPADETLVDFLATRSLLLILDNCEHVAQAAADLVVRLLACCRGLRVIATSREPLRVTGELVWRVPPLSTVRRPAARGDRGRPGSPSPRDSDALRLFEERARLNSPGFRLTRRNQSAALEICRRLDGLPLAIELAAARLSALGLGQILERLHDRFRLLVGGARTAPRRQQTLEAAIDWSYELLRPAERALFDGLAVFRDGFTLEAAEQVCSDLGPGLSEGEVLDLLSRLVDKSMVQMAESADGSVRYSLLDTLREYGWRRLEAAGQADVLRQRQVAYLLEFAGRAAGELRGPDQKVWLDRIEADHHNFRSALQWARTRDDLREITLCLAVHLSRFWYLRGHWKEGREIIESLISTPCEVHPSLRAKALQAAGVLAWAQDDYRAAAIRLEESLALFRALGDIPGIASALRRLAIVAWRRRDHARASALHEESLVLFRRLGDRSGVASAQNSLGHILRHQGDHQQVPRSTRAAWRCSAGWGRSAG